jgi:hypothetical protein
VWKPNFLRWSAGLTTDVRGNASAHGDNRSPLKVGKLSPGKSVRFTYLLLSSKHARLSRINKFLFQTCSAIAGELKKSEVFFDLTLFGVFELARLIVRFYHVASFIVNANHSIV